MALPNYIDDTLEAPISAIRRFLIAVAIAAAAGIGAIFYLAAGGLLALETIVSPAVARAIVGVVLLLVAVIAIMTPRMFRSESLVERAQEHAQSLTRDQKIALILEAVMAGFSLSSSPSRRPRKASR